MEEAKVVFSSDGVDLTIQCTLEEKMKDICQKYATQINKDINSFDFLYEGNQLNLELSFKDQANENDRNNKEMKISVYNKKESDGFFCPKCGEKNKLNIKKLEEIVLSNDEIKDNIDLIKLKIEDMMNQTLLIYNTLSRQKERFEPLHAPNVGMYVCGPTVYGDPHLGHARPAITFDLLFRYLKHLGYKVRYVRNITDVGHLDHDADEGEDKIAKHDSNSWSRWRSRSTIPTATIRQWKHSTCCHPASSRTPPDTSSNRRNS